MADPIPTRPEPRDFIRAIIEQDLESGKHAAIHTRFPPEPNGFLHIGHVKAICLSFGVAEEYGGLCNLRFDDTNPTTEDARFVEAIQDDVHWLGFDWGDRLYHASGWFEELYRLAEGLIQKGLAYVDSQSEEEIREGRGTVTEPGRPSPYRDRSVEENLDLFRRMRAGEFEDGAHVLRARIDMAASNMIMRDPLLYRIRHAHHYRTGDAWCIYPLYDFAHGLCDALEGITHSLCTLEFENNRELYDWLVREADVPATPRQIEFARLELEYTVLSKRRMLRLVNEGHVSGWDDPRMPSIVGIRRRGVRPTALRSFVDMVGVAKANSIVDIGKLEFAIRDDLNRDSPRMLCVLRPLRVVLTNWPEGKTEELNAPYFPRDVEAEGARQLPLSRVLYIERSDFAEQPPPGFHRLSPGGEVRLRHGYVIRCDEVVKDPATGEVVELRCSYDPDSLDAKGRRVKGTVHWVSAEHALRCEVRLYDRLFTVPDPGAVPEGGDFLATLNPDSLVTLTEAWVERSVLNFLPDARFQFERTGYFWQDPVDSSPEHPVFNRIVTLRDTWAEKAAAPEDAGKPARKTSPERTTVVGGTGPGGTESAAPPRPMAPAQVAEELAEQDPAARGRFERFLKGQGLGVEDARILALDAGAAELFEEALHHGAPPSPAANWIINELPRELEKQDMANVKFGGGELASLLAMVEEGTISHTAARRVLSRMARRGGDPKAIVEAEGLSGLPRGGIEQMVEGVLAANADEVARYRAGETKLLGFLVGEVMKRTRGRADAKVVAEVLRERLG
ncbi:MAG TPA: glutamine--tRNA ligase/YqeY domain fusion protein [Longimicrobiales bacterium]|nr:glutamine--tRNA ligase/YqeY domain fusion protein [Longimicrobiales bacterium]